MKRLRLFWKGLTQASRTDGPQPIENGNFTPRAQQVLTLARKEADRFHHNFVGTEHVLLGLIQLGRGTAVNVLGRMGLSLETVREEVEKQVGFGPDQKFAGYIPFTPRVKKVLTFAIDEARALHHAYVGTEHILLGLLREGDGVAARVLVNFQIDVEKTRIEILRELDPNFSDIADDAENSGMQQQPQSPSSKQSVDAVDTSKRNDVYCRESDRNVVVYRKALFKGRRKLLSKGEPDFGSEFLELEQSNGETVYLALHSVFKFCEHRAAIGGETFPSET